MSEFDRALQEYDDLLDGERRATIVTAREQLALARERLEEARSEVTEALLKQDALEVEVSQFEAELDADIAKARARLDQALWATNADHRLDTEDTL